jgi:hypothetical protein
MPNPQPRLSTERQRKDGKNSSGDNGTDIHVKRK